MLAPPKRIKICELSPIHTSDNTSDDTLPDSPPQNESKFAHPHPYTHQTTPWARHPPKTNQNLQTLTHTHIRRHLGPDTPCKTNQNLRTLTHTDIRQHLERHPARQPPPKTNPKNLRTLTPILEVRTPVAKAIWGKSNLPTIISQG